jgi:hypothetical protein
MSRAIKMACVSSIGRGGGGGLCRIDFLQAKNTFLAFPCPVYVFTYSRGWRSS